MKTLEFKAWNQEQADRLCQYLADAGYDPQPPGGEDARPGQIIGNFPVNAIDEWDFSAAPQKPEFTPQISIWLDDLADEQIQDAIAIARAASMEVAVAFGGQVVRVVKLPVHYHQGDESGDLPWQSP